MMIAPRNSISNEILDLIEWLDQDADKSKSEYAKGVLSGLRIAQHVAAVIEENSEEGCSENAVGKVDL